MVGKHAQLDQRQPEACWCERFIKLLRFLEAVDARKDDVKSQSVSLHVFRNALKVRVSTGGEALSGGRGGGRVRVSLCLPGKENKQTPTGPSGRFLPLQSP